MFRLFITLINKSLVSFISVVYWIYLFIIYRLWLHFQMPDLSHSVVSPTSFRAEYRRTGSSSVFTRNIRLQVDVAPVRKDEEDGAEETQLHCLTFTLLSGLYFHLDYHFGYFFIIWLTVWFMN